MHFIFRLIGANLLLLLAYLAAALLTLSLHLPPLNGTPVWVPTGIALGAILIWGKRLLPAVFLGDFLVACYLIEQQDLTAVIKCFMFGLQAMAHAWLANDWLRRQQLWPNALLDEKTIFRFFWIAAGASMLVVTVVFVLSEWLLGQVETAQLGWAILLWWLGGAIGVVLFTPLVLIAFAKPRAVWQSRNKRVALPLLALFLGLISLLYTTRQMEQEAQQQALTGYVNLDQELVDRGLDQALILLKAMRSYFQLGEATSNTIFDGYLHEFFDGHNFIKGVGWIDDVPSERRADYEQQFGGPILELDEQGKKRVARDRNGYLVIRYSRVTQNYVNSLHAQPDMNLFDMCFTAQRMRRCQQIWQKKAAIFPPILHASENKNFVYALPVVINGKVVGAVAHMYEYASFFSAFMQQENSRWLEFEVFDITDKANPVRLFQSKGWRTQASAKSILSDTRELAVAGRRWQFQYIPSLQFNHTYANWDSYIIATIALLVLALISLFLLAMTGRIQYVSQIVSERTRQLRTRERQYRSLVEGISDEYLIYSHDKSGIFDYISPSVTRILGYTQQQFLTHYSTYMPDTIVNREVEQHTQQTLAGENSRYELEILDNQGYIHTLRVNENPRYDESGQITGVEGIAHDITQLKEAQVEWKKMLLAVEHNPNAIMIMDRHGVIEYVNPKFTAITGFTAEEVVGQLPDMLKSDLTPEDVYQEIGEKLRAGKEWHGELQNRTKKGTFYWARGYICPLQDEHGRVTHFIATHEDVTYEKRRQDEISYQASHDALTGLINRREFETRLRRVLTSAKQDRSEHALCFMDLDRFKRVNDLCGHVAGDELLRQIGELLQANIRQRDTLARLGGDEFALLMEHCSIEQAYETCQKIIDLLAGFRFHWEEQVFTVGVSIGLASIDAHIRDSEEVLGFADNACYQAKHAGRNRVEVHSPDSQKLQQRRKDIQWHNEIKAALEASRFVLYAQPIQPLASSALPGYEILLRLKLGNGDIALPDTFLPAAERYNLAIDLDRWVIQHTVYWMSQHRDYLAHIDGLAVNLSGQTLGDDAILGFILRELQQSDIPADKLKFEITETAAIANLRDATVFIHTLKEMGCRFALDDFGSGLSSFAYLKNLQVDRLKIDGLFVRNCLDNPIDLEMVKSINNIGHVMGLETVAECVEDAATLATLKEIHVDFVQGHMVGSPRPIDDILDSVDIQGQRDQT